MDLVAAPDGGGESPELQAEAFKRVYPEQYFAKFFDQGIRPDGRPFRVGRPLSIVLGVITTANASALVKIGSSTALAGVKCEISSPDPDRPDEGTLEVEVEMPPLCCADCRPGRPDDRAMVLSEQLNTLLVSKPHNVIDLRHLGGISSNKAAVWTVHVDVYVLDNDGSLFETCLLATVAALKSLSLPEVKVDESGNILGVEGGGMEYSAQALAQGRPLEFRWTPVALTSGIYKNKLLVDPTFEEEQVVGSLVVGIVDEQGALIRVTKPGGSGISQDGTAFVKSCHEATKQRAVVVRQLLDAAIQEYHSQLTDA
jgi:exosome complex component RRP43